MTTNAQDAHGSPLHRGDLVRHPAHHKPGVVVEVGAERIEVRWAGAGGRSIVLSATVTKQRS